MTVHHEGTHREAPTRRRPLEPEDLGTILAVWAHPDDETYLAGGLMARAVGNGQRVVVVSATAGEHGTDDPGAWPPARLGAVRRWEAAAAMAALGVTEHHWLDYEDGTLADLDAAEAVDRLVALTDEVRPDTICTFGPDGITFHTDHQAVSHWMTAVWERTGRAARLLHAAESEEVVARWWGTDNELGVYMTDEMPVGVPSRLLAVDLLLADVELDRKVTALRAMHTQTAGTIDGLGERTFRTLVAVEQYVAVAP